MPPAPNSAGTDVLIIGGGIVGLCCAHYLERAGRRPTVIERDRVGRGSSYGNGGLIAPSHSIPLPAPGVVRQGIKWLFAPESPFVIRPQRDPALAEWLMRFAWSARRAPMLRGIPTLRELNRLSAALYRELASELHGSCTYAGGGVINVYRTTAAFEKGRREAALLADHDIPSRTLSSVELSDVEPGLNTGLAGGVLWPEDGYADPAEMLCVLRADLERRGVAVYEDTEVLAIAAEKTGAHVTTTAGVLDSDYVIVAAGAWSPALLRSLGCRLKVQPAKGYSVTIHEPATTLRHPLLLPEAKVAVTPLAGALRLAGTLELAGLSMAVDMRRLGAVRRAADPYLRHGSGGTSETVWRGLRALSADGIPMIGPVAGQERVIAATGHGHIGMTLGPATGRIVADMLSGAAPMMDMASLGPSR